MLKEIAVALWDMLITYERITNSDSSNTVLAQNGVSVSTFNTLNTFFHRFFVHVFPLNDLTPSHFNACLKPGPEFLTSYVVVIFFVLSE